MSSKLATSHLYTLVFHLCLFVRVSGVSVFHDREIRAHKVLKCHDVQMVSSCSIADTIWSLKYSVRCIENHSMKTPSSKSVIRAQISSGVRRPMPPPPVPSPQKTDLTPATEHISLDSRTDSSPNTPGRHQAGSSTSLVRGEMNVPTGQGEESTYEQMRYLRELLMPPPIEGLVDWGIPPVTTEACGPTLEVWLHKPPTNVHSHPSMTRRSSPISTTSNARKTSISTPRSCPTSPSVTLTCMQSSWSLWTLTKAGQIIPRTCGIPGQG